MQILNIINNYYHGGGGRGQGQGRDQVASIPDVADDPHQSAQARQLGVHLNPLHPNAHAQIEHVATR